MKTLHDLAADKLIHDHPAIRTLWKSPRRFSAFPPKEKDQAPRRKLVKLETRVRGQAESSLRSR